MGAVDHGTLKSNWLGNFSGRIHNGGRAGARNRHEVVAANEGLTVCPQRGARRVAASRRKVLPPLHPSTAERASDTRAPKAKFQATSAPPRKRGQTLHTEGIAATGARGGRSRRHKGPHNLTGALEEAVRGIRNLRPGIRGRLLPGAPLDRHGTSRRHPGCR